MSIVRNTKINPRSLEAYTLIKKKKTAKEWNVAQILSHIMLWNAMVTYEGATDPV